MTARTIKNKTLKTGLFIALCISLPWSLGVNAEIHLAATTTSETPTKNAKPIRINPGVSPRQVRTAGQQPTCSGAPLPDIAVQGINIDGPRKPGKIHKVTVSVVNQGQCATGKFAIKATMRVQGQGVDKPVNLGNRGVPSLQPCRSKNCAEASFSTTFSFRPAYNHALYTVTVEADAGNSVSEFRENNNKIVDEMRIQNN
jgi:hypothetical protein